MVFSSLKQPEVVPPKPPDDGGGGGSQPRHSTGVSPVTESAVVVTEPSKEDDTLRTNHEYGVNELNKNLQHDSITHGDWMVVDRKKFKKKSPSGAKDQEIIKGDIENRFGILANSESSHVQEQSMKNVTNKSGSHSKGATPKIKWVRKRSRNNEVKIHNQGSPSQPTIDTLASNGPNNSIKAQIARKEPHSKGKATVGFSSATTKPSSSSVLSTSLNTTSSPSSSKPNFKSAMNIEWVAGNRFCFTDDDEDEDSVLKPPNAHLPPRLQEAATAIASGSDSMRETKFLDSVTSVAPKDIKDPP
ncbi:hypothetical protein RIF29_05603 [Crotalaria pallida]|uniref:Uncharacterized protein n=1 Tax=Crotalaria pallida TaxID=3830 RepID=A0AAN9J281_CROPI